MGRFTTTFICIVFISLDQPVPLRLQHFVLISV